MTREEAKELLPIIQAWAEGKNIQFLSDGEWHDINQADFTCYPDKYRIKPEPKYRPFKNRDECWGEMLKHQPFGWFRHKRNNYYELIRVDISEDAAFKSLFNVYNFADGTPFGILEN